MNRRRQSSGGFTLMEALIASAVLAFSVAAISYAVSAGQAQTYASLHEQRALSLAEAMMEEVLSLPYADPQGTASLGPDAGETSRALFDNADDYHGFTQAAGNIRDHSGELYESTFQVFTRSVSAAYQQMSISGLGSAMSGLNVTVTVTDAKGRSWTLTRFIPEPAS